MFMMHQWITALQFSQLKHHLQSARFNVLLIIWPMIIDFFLLGFCQSFRGKKKKKFIFLTGQMSYLSLSFSIDTIS